nr:hypothetical protein [Sneathiella glossodoripedis]
MTQNGVPFVQPEELRNSFDRLGSLFTDVSFYMAAIPSYVGGSLAFGWATDNKSLRSQDLGLLAERYLSSGISTDYYNPEVHKAAFALPYFVQKILTEEV